MRLGDWAFKHSTQLGHTGHLMSEKQDAFNL